MSGADNVQPVHLSGREELEHIYAEIRSCTLCPLHKGRTHAVPGEGPVNAEIMFIGEGPGFHEDRQGRPFVGASGQFLEQTILGIGFRREDVYITNVVKCRPPGNRDPERSELEACRRYLDRQIELIQPKIIVTLGRFSMARFFPGQSITRVHGKPRRADNVIYYPLFHPAAALRNPQWKVAFEQDMRRIPELLESLKSREAESVANTPEDDPDEGGEQLSLF